MHGHHELTRLVSMWPLLKKDGLALQYVAVTLLWNRAIGYNPFRVNCGLFIRILSLASGLQLAPALTKRRTFLSPHMGPF